MITSIFLISMVVISVVIAVLTLIALHDFLNRKERYLGTVTMICIGLVIIPILIYIFLGGK